MVQVQQRVLIGSAFLVLLASPAADARKFYPDDPLTREPKPLRVEKADKAVINEYYDFFQNSFFEPDKRKGNEHPGPAQGVNTLGGVPDSAWYVNRHWRRRMTIAELVRGPDQGHAPAADGPWTLVSGKNEGVTPGFVIRDARGRVYLVKFDPASNPEMASAADVIVSKFFYALGYNVPENYIVHFGRDRLKLDENSRFRDENGHERRMVSRDVDDVLKRIPLGKDGRYRGAASLYLPGDAIGPFRYWGVRSDDPNDIVPHEQRRDLRGLFVLAAWLNHTDTKSSNSLDTIVNDSDLRYIRHYLIDFGSTLGSDSFAAKSAAGGHAYMVDLRPAALQMLTLGLLVPAWARVSYPDIPAAGRFGYQAFDPEKWKSNYPNPAFNNRLPDDEYWAARQVMNFTDEEIRAIVQTGEFSDPRAVDWITRCLVERRDKIGRAYFDNVLPLDHFAVRGGRLEFDDLAAKHHFVEPRRFRVSWSWFDNQTERMTPLAEGRGFTIPARLLRAGGEAYCIAEISGGAPGKSVVVYVRHRDGRLDIAGIERRW